MNAEWKWDFAFQILPQMLWATLNTIMAAGIGYAIAAVVGLLFLLGQRTPYKIINVIVREIIEFIRSTPLLIQLFFVYFVGPQFGITLSAWVCAMITIGLHFGTYLSEVYRGALEGVPKTQWEACRALNFKTLYTYRRIVLPQAFPIAIPGMGNYLVGIFKDTPSTFNNWCCRIISCSNRCRRLSLSLFRAIYYSWNYFLNSFSACCYGYKKIRKISK